ncbi:MAG: sigma-54 dependent transcriptional regulator [Alphaproteobacteria bacterium]
MAQSVLIVDDDPTQRRLMESVLARQGYKVTTAAGGKEAIALVDSGKASDTGVMLLDLVMPEVDGYAVLEHIKKVLPGLPVIVLTAQGRIDTVVSAMRAGAADFVVKPASPERLLVSIQNALKLNTLTGEVQRLKRRQSGQLSFDDLIAKAPTMQQVIRLGRRAAQSNIPILIEGESGSGKELIARAIQGASDRSGKPFVAVNCGALPENLVESILFGHEKGAFTGASEKHMGKFQEASGGTLFLDEIGELRLDIQVKLLRALQEGEVDPVGASKPVKVDIRLISATNRDLLKMAQAGEFREDLYYRLNVFPILVPPLRERREDIPDLIDYFIQRFAVEEGKKVAGIEPKSLEVLLEYGWPGNVRQLENAVFRAVVLAEEEWLSLHDFPQIAGFMRVALPERRVVAASAAAPGGPQTQDAPAGVIVSDAVGTRPIYTAPHDAAAMAPPGQGIQITDAAGHLRPLEEIEGQMIKLAIEKYDGHMSEVARRLGIGRSTLYRKVRDLGLEPHGEE